MKFALICLPLTSFVGADECQEFCVRSLSDIGCTRGSYCKSNGFCHSLQWTNESRVDICVFGESLDCNDVYPVSCSEAREPVFTSTLAPELPTSSQSVVHPGQGHFHDVHHTHASSNATHAHADHAHSHEANDRAHRENIHMPGALWARRRTRVSTLGVFCSPVGTPISCCTRPHQNETRMDDCHSELDEVDHPEQHHHH
jgi:hypothetical protein